MVPNSPLSVSPCPRSDVFFAPIPRTDSETAAIWRRHVFRHPNSQRPAYPYPALWKTHQLRSSNFTASWCKLVGGTTSVDMIFLTQYDASDFSTPIFRCNVSCTVMAQNTRVVSQLVIPFKTPKKNNSVNGYKYGYNNVPSVPSAEHQPAWHSLN